MSLNQQNARLQKHVLLFIEKLEIFIAKAQNLKEEKRKMRFHLTNEPPNEILVQKQRELDSTQNRIKEYRKQIKEVRTFF